MSLYFRQLAMGFNAGIPIVSILEILATEGSTYRESTVKLLHRISAGWKLSAAFRAEEQTFPKLFWGLVAVGEETGGLGRVFERLADWQERESKLLSRFLSALTYPALVIGTTLVCFWLMATNVLPTFVKVLESLNAPLPLPTKLILGAVSLLRYPSLYILLALFLGAWAYFFSQWASTPQGRYNIEQVIWRVPVLGSNFHYLGLTRLFACLQMSNAVGLNTLRSLRISYQACGSEILQRDGEKLQKAVQEGFSVAEYMATQPDLYPSLVVGLVRVAEEAGGLQSAFATIRDFYELELEESLQRFLDLLEPALIAGVSLIAGFVMLSLLLPLSNVLQQL